MLSPGKWHLRVPKDLKTNLQFRKYVLESARGNRGLQQGLIHVCKNDIIFFINVFGWQYNPKLKGNEVGPFITWDFQEAALLDRPETTGKRGILWCYEKNRTCVVEKSREIGASWLFLFVQDYLSILHDYKQCLNISRSADAVDSKSKNSLFWKLKFIHEHLPDWLKGPIVEEKMYMLVKRTKSEISGEASTGRAGVGGRASTIFIDEFSEIKEATEVREKTANTADSRFFNGTHLGADTEFYRLTQSPEIVKIQMHWTQHPEKKKGMYRYNRMSGKVEILDKDFEYGPQCPDCRMMWPKLKVGEDCPECARPTKDFAFVMDGSPTGGPFPGVRSPWYDWKVTDMGSSRAAASQLDIDPQGSASQFFDALKIAELIQIYARPPVWEGELDYDPDLGRPRGLVKRSGGKIKLWLNPDMDGQPPRGRYSAGADVSGGSGSTPSCLTIGNIDTGEKVLEYANALIDPQDFGVFCVALCRMFRDEDGGGAHFAWEVPGPGETLGKRVVDLGYLNVHCRSPENDLKFKMSTLPGWVATSKTNRDLLEEYKHALYRGGFLNRSEEALRQCLMFEYTPTAMVEHGNIACPNDPSGARWNHGDLVIADALCYKMMQKMGLKPTRKIEVEEPEGSLGWRRRLRQARERDKVLEWA